MPDDQLLPAQHGLLSELYTECLGYLATEARDMVISLPGLAAQASHRELGTVFRDCLSMASRHSDALDAMMSRLGQPAAVRPDALEALLGQSGRQLMDWPLGDSRDVALCLVVRSALHTAVATRDVVIAMARPLGHLADARELTRMRDEVEAEDRRLRRAAEVVIESHFDAGTGKVTSGDRAVPPRESAP